MPLLPVQQRDLIPVPLVLLSINIGVYLLYDRPTACVWSRQLLLRCLVLLEHLLQERDNQPVQLILRPPVWSKDVIWRSGLTVGLSVHDVCPSEFRLEK